MLSLAVSSYKFRMLEQNKKTSLYASEAGLDEAYEIMGKFVQYGIEQGNKAVEKYNENFDKLIEYKRENKDINYISENGVINNATVTADVNRVFQEGYKVDTTSNLYSENGTLIEKGYKTFIETGLSIGEGVYKLGDDLSKGGIDNLIEKLSTNEYKINTALNDVQNNIKIQAEKVDETFIENKPVVISVESSYTHNSIPKIIKATYDINVAKYNVQYNLPTQIVKIPKNPMWSKALMVNGDMKINEGNVIVGNENNASDLNNTGIYVAGKDVGIDLKNNTAALKVIGNVVTNKNLMLSYNGDNGTVNNNVDVKGNIYARNVIIDKSTVTDSEGNVISESEAKGGKIYTSKIDSIRDGSVYLMDDLEINGEKSTVDIAGSYYGVSDGSEGERNNPDNSSSIIINTEDIGNRADDNNHTLANSSALTIGKNVYIAGTSYINLLNNLKYQTGESISIVGNYRAYTEALPFTNEYLTKNNNANVQFKEDNVIFDYLDPLTLVTKYNKNESDNSRKVKATLEKDRYITVNLTQVGKVDEICKDAISYSVIYNNKESKITPIGETVKIDTPINNLDSESNKPVVTVKLYKLGNVFIEEELNVSLVSSIEMNAFDKSEYFQEYYKQFPTENGLNLGEGITINKSIGGSTNAENIHAGNIFTSQNSSDPIGTGNWSIDLDRKIKARSIQLKNQLFYMGKANDYEGLLSTTNVDAIQDTIDTTDSKYYEIDDRTEPVVTINNNVNFDNLSPKSEVINDEIAILGNDDSKTYVLMEDGLDDTKYETMQNKEIKKISANHQYKGIIIVKGNVIIDGSFDFKGTIICNGNLTFEGVGDKKITYDKGYLEQFAINNYKLFKDTFTDFGVYGQNNDSNYLFAKIYNNSNGASNIDDEFTLIKRKKWELIK